MRRITCLVATLDPPGRAVTAMSLALLTVLAVARLGGPAFAPEAVAEAIMARTPASLANHILAVAGDWARPVALLGGIATLLGVAAAAGVVEALVAAGWVGRRRLNAVRTAQLGFAVGGAVAAAGWIVVVVLLRQPPLPHLVAALVFTLAWWLLHLTGGPAVLSDRPPSDVDLALPELPLARRRLLTGFAVSGVAVMVMANLAFVDAVRRARAGAARAGSWLFTWSEPAPRVAGFDTAGIEPEVTPVERFYRMSKNVVDPNLTSDSWRLEVGGQRWSLDDLLAMPQARVLCTLRCISNAIDSRLMSTAEFSGVRLSDLLARAGLAAESGWVVFHGFDGHSDAIEAEAASEPDTLVALAMNGRLLTRAHGFPARLLIPGKYGFKNVKWLRRISLSAAPYGGHWQQLGWTRQATVKTMSRIDVAHTTVDGTVAAGVAFAGTRGIGAVRVRFDDGAEQEALLHAPPLGRSTWVQWQLRVPGRYRRVQVRAVDGGGTSQLDEARGQFPDGAQGLHQVDVREATR